FHVGLLSQSPFCAGCHVLVAGQAPTGVVEENVDPWAAFSLRVGLSPPPTGKWTAPTACGPLGSTERYIPPSGTFGGDGTTVPRPGWATTSHHQPTRSGASARAAPANAIGIAVATA